MKRFILTLLLIGGCSCEAFAGKWDSISRGAYGLYLAMKNPEQAFSILGFLIDLLLACIPIAIVAGIVSLIVKAVFDLDQDDTIKCFLVVGGFLLVVWFLLYIIA